LTVTPSHRPAAALLVDRDPAACVAIVADRRLAVAALAALLTKDSDYRLVQETCGSVEVAQMLATHRPALVVEDLSSLVGSMFGLLDDPGARHLVIDPLDDPADFPDTVRQAMQTANSSVPSDSPKALSGRELEILALIASGRGTKEIARDYAITPKTVGNHVSNIFHKLDLHHRGELVLFALQHGLASL